MGAAEGLRNVVKHPEWQSAVLGGLPDDVRTVAQANLDAGNALTASDLGPPLPSLPDWTILVPKSVDELVGYYKEAEAGTGIPWPYFAAIHFVETKTGRIRGNSTAGAGPMQFIPSTWPYTAKGISTTTTMPSVPPRYLQAAAAGRHGQSDPRAQPERCLCHGDPAVRGVIMADPRAFDGYHAWQVYVSTVDGTTYLPEGWHK
jgi:hypothetical protein